MQIWSNFIGYQLVWFITVLQVPHGHVWPGMVAAGLFAAWQLAIAPQRLLELGLIVTALLSGALIDGGLAALGLLQYASASPALPSGGAPLWILTLWAAFSLTINRSLAWLMGKPLLAVAFGALGGPLAYLSAARGWSAVTFVAPEWRAIVWLAVGWGGAMFLFVRWVAGGSARLPVARHLPKGV